MDCDVNVYADLHTVGSQLGTYPLGHRGWKLTCCNIKDEHLCTMTSSIQTYAQCGCGLTNYNIVDVNLRTVTSWIWTYVLEHCGWRNACCSIKDEDDDYDVL